MFMKVQLKMIHYIFKAFNLSKFRCENFSSHLNINSLSQALEIYLSQNLYQNIMIIIENLIIYNFLF